MKRPRALWRKYLRTNLIKQHNACILQLNGRSMLVCTLKQNLNNESQSLVVVVNQDSTHRTKWVEKLYTFEAPLCIAKANHLWEGLLSFASLFLGSMDMDEGTLLLSSLSSWIWLEEWVLQKPPKKEASMFWNQGWMREEYEWHGEEEVARMLPL